MPDRNDPGSIGIGDRIRYLDSARGPSLCQSICQWEDNLFCLYMTGHPDKPRIIFVLYYYLNVPFLAVRKDNHKRILFQTIADGTFKVVDGDYIVE